VVELVGVIFAEIFNQLKEFEKNLMRLSIRLKLLFSRIFPLKF